jgi:hypothetical protein
MRRLPLQSRCRRAIRPQDPPGHAAACGGSPAVRWRTASISAAPGTFTALPSAHALRKASAASRRQKKHGRWPAASATASSRKNNSVQLRRAITARRRPLNSQRHVSQALVAQRRFSSVRVAGSWMIPRLPMNMPLCGIETISPNGVTRFCNGIGSGQVFNETAQKLWGTVKTGRTPQERPARPEPTGEKLIPASVRRPSASKTHLCEMRLNSD